MQKILTPVYLEMGIKRNWTISNFCNDLNINEDEFRRSLKKTFSAKTERYYLSRLESNEKLARKHAKSKNKPESETEEIKSVANTEVSEEPSELEVCKARETELKDLIFKAEVQLQVLKEKKSIQKQELEKVYRRFEAILSEATKLEKEIDDVKSKLGSIQSQLSDVASKKTEANKELKTVQAKIQQLEIFTIFYTTSGEIKVLGFDGTIPELEIDKTLNEMMEIELLEDLTLKELRIMARIIATAVYVKNTTNRDIRFDFEEASNISAAIELMDEMSKENDLRDQE